MTKQVPQEIYKCRDWLLSKARMNDASAITRVIVAAEQGKQVEREIGEKATEILEEFTGKKRRSTRTTDWSDFAREGTLGPEDVARAFEKIYEKDFWK